MERRLYEAAVEGSVTALTNLLHEDAVILDRYMLGSFGETPLHVAVMLGHVEFAKEILRLKPEWAGELDSKKSSPLHLASAKGCVEIVGALLLINPDMCYVCDRDGRNPLHVAAIRGRISTLEELVRCERKAGHARLHRGETILHLCVLGNQLEALKFLVGSLGDEELLNAEDDEGNTILHVAVADKQIETVEYLLNSTSIEVNAPNAYGFTAMDILFRSRRDIKDLDIAECLQSVGAVKLKIRTSPQSGFRDARARDLPPDQSNRTTQLKRNYPKKQDYWMLSARNLPPDNNNRTDSPKKQDNWVDNKRDSLMIVASLIATMAFQAGVNPPGGVWQDNTNHTAGASIMAYGNGNETQIIKLSRRLGFQNTSLYNQFLAFNSTGFITSLSIILLLVSGLPLRRRFLMWVLMVTMWAAITSMAYTYLIALSVVTPSHKERPVNKVIMYAVVAWLGLMLLLLVVHTVRLLTGLIMLPVRLIKKLTRLGRRNRTVIQV